MSGKIDWYARMGTTLTNGAPMPDVTLDELVALAAQIEAMPRPERYIYCTTRAWEAICVAFPEVKTPPPPGFPAWAVGYATMDVTVVDSVKLPRCGWVALHERDAELDEEARQQAARNVSPPPIEKDV